MHTTFENILTPDPPSFPLLHHSGDWVYDSFHKTVKDTIKKEVGAKQLCEIKKNEMTKRANGVLRSLSDQNKGLVKAFLIATYGRKSEWVTTSVIGL